MTIATNTTEGEILMGGDLDPTSTGDLPLLRASGVTPGTYNYQAVGVDGDGNSIIKITKAVIDPKGRITYAKSEKYTITSVVATSSTFGIVKVDGTTVTVADGVISSITGALPLATASTLGAVKPDNSTTFVDGNGVLTVVVPKATSSTLGGVKYDNVTTYNGAGGTASIYTASTTNFGIARPDYTSLKFYDGKLGLAIATNSSVGIMQADNSTCTIGSGASEGVLFPAVANSTVKGIVRPDNTTITIQNGIISTPVVYATSSTVGVVKADENTLSVGSGGTLTLKKSTVASLGIARPDNITMSINAGILSLNPATSSMLGIVKVDGSTIESNVGSLIIPSAISSLPGVIKPDGTTLIINEGGSLAVPPASYDIPGVVRPANTSLHEATRVDSNGVISIDHTTTTNYGAAKPDNITTRVSDGIIDVVTASATTNGIVLPGDYIQILSDGTIKSSISNDYTMATSNAIGKVKVDGTSLITDINGNLSAPIATSSNRGLISFDDDFRIYTDGSERFGIKNAVGAATRIYTATQLYQEQISNGGASAALGSANNNSNNLKIIANSVNKVVDGFTGDAKIGAQYVLRISKTSEGINVIFPATATIGGFKIEGGSLLPYEANTETLLAEMVVIDIGGQPFGLIYNQQVI